MRVDKINFFLDKNKEERFAQSLKETGFAVITGSPLPGDLLQATYQEWGAFFRSQEKRAYLFNPEEQSGYFPFKSENAKGASAKDLKEFYHLFKPSDLPPSMSNSTLLLRSHLIQMAETLLGWLQKESPEDVLSQLSMPLPKMIECSTSTLLRVLHYPPLLAAIHPDEIRAAAHEDINLITLLPSATAAGLEVQDSKGEWYEVPCDPNSIIINAGDMLQLATGGYYRSTTHRVVNPPGLDAKNSRYSIPLFLHPRADVTLGGGHTAVSYLAERLAELGLKK